MLSRGTAHALFLASLALALLLAGLGRPTFAQTDPATPQPLTTPAEVQLRVGDSASFDDGALRVTLLDVAEDSRCPKDVACVWAGQAVVWLQVVLDGVDRGEVEVTLYPAPPADRSHLDVRVDRYVISLLDLQPYPVASQPEPLSQRVATVRVEMP